MKEQNKLTMGQVLSSMTVGQVWAVVLAIATSLAAVGGLAFHIGQIDAEASAARQVRSDSQAQQAAINEASQAREQAANWKGKYDNSHEEASKSSKQAADDLAKMRDLATYNAQAANNAIAAYNRCAAQGSAIAALEARLRIVDNDLRNAEVSSFTQPGVAQGLRDQQRILNEGLANCGLPKQ